MAVARFVIHRPQHVLHFVRGVAAHDVMLTETTLSIIHARLTHVGGSTIHIHATIHLRCLSLLDSLLVHLARVWVEASVAGRGVQLLLGHSRITSLLCLRVGKVGWAGSCEDL